MGWQEDLEEAAKIAFTGGIYAAVKAAEQQARESNTGLLGAHGPISVPAPAPTGLGGRGSCGCDRFQFADGMLLDKESGRLWEYDSANKILIPIVPIGSSGSDLERLLAVLYKLIAKEEQDKKRTEESKGAMTTAAASTRATKSGKRTSRAVRG